MRDSGVRAYQSLTDTEKLEQRIQRMQTERIRQKDADALNNLLKSEDGRWFLMRLLDATGINATAFTGNSTTFYNEGRRDIGVQLNNRIHLLGLEAIKNKQKAELEYLQLQIEIRQNAEMQMSKE